MHGKHKLPYKNIYERPTAPSRFLVPQIADTVKFSKSLKSGEKQKSPQIKFKNVNFLYLVEAVKCMNDHFSITYTYHTCNYSI
jgi:hypothetical protein